MGIGPGPVAEMSPRAQRAIEACDIIIGYNTYVKFIGGLVEGKQVVPFGMGQELARARRAIEEALSGKRVALISSGDPGIYGMAGPVLEVLRRDGIVLDLEIVPGIPALSSCNASLGAPLMNDFAVISLSDLLTSPEVIMERLEAAARGDFVVVLYNPRSTKRSRLLREARRVLLKYRSPRTWVGIVKNAGREGEEVFIADLASLPEAEIDMQTTVIVGNSSTLVLEGRMVTPRGYGDNK